MKKRPKKKYDEVNYWESMADSMVGLLLCLLLILLLLVLYLVRIPKDPNIDTELGNSYAEYDEPNRGDNDHDWDNWEDYTGDDWEHEDDRYPENYNSSGGGGYGGGRDDHPYDEPTPDVEEGRDKAAIFVQLVDGETGRTIKLKGVEFELYADGALEELSVYYPKKVDYRKFKTDEEGTFYLPERVNLRAYSLHALSSIEGYGRAENTDFEPDRTYEWDDPYVVTVMVSPEKNVIRMQTKDRADGTGIAGAVFEVVATENVTTQDGTVRYKAGEIVDTVTVDGTGYGESKELYLGEYSIRQKTVPEYYAKMDEVSGIALQGKNTSTAVTELLADKTAVNVMLQDALYDVKVIQGAEFTLSDDAGNVIGTYTTNEKGSFTVKDLKKNKTYYINQTKGLEHYKLSNETEEFNVGEDGLILGNATHEVLFKNRMIRITIGVQDKLFRGQISDMNIAIRDSQGNVIKSWNSSGLEYTLEGLEPGEYEVILSGNEANSYKITVEDKTDVQQFKFSIWTAMDFGSLIGAGLAAILIIVVLVVLIKAKAKKKLEEDEE